MSKDALMNRYRELNQEMREQYSIAMDPKSESDDVIRARKEVERIQHDIGIVIAALEGV